MRAVTGWLIAIFGAAVIAVSVYLGVGIYYLTGFSYGSVINGMDMTGLSVEETNKKLTAAYSYDSINVVDKNSEDYVVSMEAIGYKVDYTNALNEYKDEHPAILWGKNLLNKTNTVIEPEVTFSEELLERELRCAPFMEEGGLYNADNKMEIVKTAENGYQIQDTSKNMLHPDKAVSVVSDAIYDGKAVVNLMEEGCYESIDNPELEQKIHNLYAKIDDFQSFHLIYDFGDTEEYVDSSVTSSWIALDDDGNFMTDEEGNLVLDESAVRAYVADLAAKYDTKEQEREFTSTSGKLIHFDKNQVLYGTTIDQAGEVKALLEDIQSGERGIRREPKYLSKAFATGLDDVGDTYIEINFTEQHLYYYKRGQIIMESDFVSGNMSRGHGTPQLFAYVRNKAKNVTLIGDDYESFVYYWMGIWRGYGMHDATWRGKFGGQIYKTSGSHGCVNLPLSFIKDFYPEVEVGTPLIMFYEPEEPKTEEKKEGPKPAQQTQPATGQTQTETQAQPQPQPEAQPQPEVPAAPPAPDNVPVPEM